MTDVRETIDRIGSRFEPPDGGWEELSRRRTRARIRRRIRAGALAVVVAVLGSVVAVRALWSEAPSTRRQPVLVATFPAVAATASSSGSSGSVTCPTPTGDSPAPVTLSSSSGSAGSTVNVSGRFVNDEAWLQLWWNADPQHAPDHIAPPPWPPTGPQLAFPAAGPGPVLELGSVEGPESTGECTFTTRFTVPDVPPGTYQVLWASGFGAQPEGGGAFALFASSMDFEVTA
jgi:hypothetical protein